MSVPVGAAVGSALPSQLPGHRRTGLTSRAGAGSFSLRESDGPREET